MDTLLHNLFEKEFNYILDHNLEVQKQDNIKNDCINNSLIHKYNCQNHIFRITNKEIDIYEPVIGLCVILDNTNGFFITWAHCWLQLQSKVIECSYEVLERRKGKEFYYFDTIKSFKEMFPDFENDYYKELIEKIISLKKGFIEYEPKFKKNYKKHIKNIKETTVEF